MADRFAKDAASVTVKSLSAALSRNLRRHSSSFASISAVCRACGINRQQFNKYLTGETLPSLINLVKIADALGVEIDELVSPPSAKIWKSGDPAVRLAALGGEKGLEIRAGYYLDYTVSSVFTDRLLVSLARIARTEAGYSCRVKLRYGFAESPGRRIFNYSGQAFSTKDTIYVNYVHEANPSDVVYCIMQPDMRYSADMIGVRNAMSSSSPPIPFAASFYMRYLGETTDLRAAFRQCGLFRLDALDPTQARALARLRAKTQTLPGIIRIADV